MLLPSACLLLGAGLYLAPAEPFQPVLPIDLSDEAWGNGLAPAQGPDRDGQPTIALKWDVATLPGPNSPLVVTSFQDVAAIRFQLYLDGPHDFRLNVLLTGRGGYYNYGLSLDWTGWKQLTIPIEKFGKAHDPRLEDMRGISFRMQGYGQPELDPEMVWWLDQFELQPQPGKQLPLTTSLEYNHQQWVELAEQGNPYVLLNARRYERPLGEFRPPEQITSTWQYRGLAEQVAPVAWAASDPDSPCRARADLIAYAIASVDYLVEACSLDGWWYTRGKPGDPNVNRFTLGPLLDAVIWLRRLPEGQAAWPRWQDRLDAAIELQKKAYRGEIDWDWGGLAGGEYANQDLYYVLNMAQSAILYDRPADQQEAAAMLRKVADNLLPDGGISYIGIENEAPVYHSLNLVLIGRYATLTGDPAAVKLLRDTANYYPLVLTAEGQPEYWSDVWWKQTWGYVWPAAVVIAAGGTGDARNQSLMWRVLERVGPDDGGWAGVCAMPYWPGTDPGQALPGRYLVADRNLRGIRGRAGQWYYGLGLGRGLRNTFAGGLITLPQRTKPLAGAVAGFQIDVRQPNDRGHGLWLSQIDDRGQVVVGPDESGAMGVRYRLQPSLINGWPTPDTPDTPWQVTQLWHCSSSGLLGLVALEALDDAPGVAVEGRVAVLPAAPARVKDNLWQAGPLAIQVLQSFGQAVVKPVGRYAQPEDQGKPGLVFQQALKGEAKRGERFVYAVSVGPQGGEQVSVFEPLPGDLGWVAELGGLRVAVLFNPGAKAVTARVPWSGAAPQAYRGQDGQGAAVAVQGGHVAIELAAAECVLLER